MHALGLGLYLSTAFSGGSDAIGAILAKYPGVGSFLIRDFDPARKLSGLDRLYTLSGGSQTVTALADPIGLVIEESGNGARTTLLTDDFSYADDTALNAAYSAGGTVGTLTMDNGRMKITNSAAGGACFARLGAISTAVGRTYRASIDVEGVTAGGLLIAGTTLGGNQLASSGTVNSLGSALIVFTATTTTTFITPRNTSGADLTARFDNLVVEEISGGIATQATTSACGTLQYGFLPAPVDAQPELLTNGTFDTDTSGWTISPNHTAAIVSGRLHLEASLTGYTYQAIPTVIGKTYRVQVRAYYVSGAAFTGLRKADNAATSVNLVDIAHAGIAASGTLVTAYFTATAVTTYIICQVNNTNVAEYDDISVKEVPDSAFRKVWRGDGVDDNLLTSFFTGASTTVILACKFNAAGDYLMGASEAANKRFQIGTGGAGGLFAWCGSSLTGPALDIRGVPCVVALRGDGSLVSLFFKALADGNTIKTTTPQTDTPTTLHPIRLGAFNASGVASAPFEGDIFAAFAIQAALTDAEIEAVANQFSK